MSYSSHDRDDLFIIFYKVVNNMIYDIHMSENISKYLFYCNYINLVNHSKNNYPLTILGEQDISIMKIYLKIMD